MQFIQQKDYKYLWIMFYFCLIVIAVILNTLAANALAHAKDDNSGMLPTVTLFFSIIAAFSGFIIGIASLNENYKDKAPKRLPAFWSFMGPIIFLAIFIMPFMFF